MTELRAMVYVSWGLWVALCPRDGCLGSEHFGHAPITGHVGGLTRVGFRCNRCGLVCPAEWPANAEDIWRVLAQRPLPETRSWNLGEPLNHLIAENAAHGLIAPETIGELGGIVIIDDRLNDIARTLVPAPQGPLREIGG